MCELLEIRHATSLVEVIKYFQFAKIGQKLSKNHPRNEKYYAKQFLIAPDLLLAAYMNNQLIGVLLGSLETDKVLIGEFYIEKTYQKQGIGSQILRAMEANVIKRNIRHVYLGANPKAEGFYLKNNYTPELFVEFIGNNQKVKMDELIRRHSNYHVTWRQDKHNRSKAIFQTNSLNKELQDDLQKTFPTAKTIYLFTKDL